MKDLSPELNTKQTLICVPYAGGYSNSFLQLKKHIPNELKIISFDPPGHGSNLSPLIDDLEELVSLYLKECSSFLGGEFILFGHSMGGIIVYRMAQLLESQGIFPSNVIISAMSPPGMRKQSSHLNDEEFIQYISDMGGIPEEILQHQELLQYILPVIRTDFYAIDNYVIDDLSPLCSPISLINGTEDLEYSPQKALAWKKWGKEVCFSTVEGGHMFILRQAEAVGSIIKEIFYKSCIRD